jgi:hypothetical protein
LPFASPSRPLTLPLCRTRRRAHAHAGFAAAAGHRVHVRQRVGARDGGRAVGDAVWARHAVGSRPHAPCRPALAALRRAAQKAARHCRDARAALSRHCVAPPRLRRLGLERIGLRRFFAHGTHGRRLERATEQVSTHAAHASAPSLAVKPNRSLTNSITLGWSGASSDDGSDDSDDSDGGGLVRTVTMSVALDDARVASTLLLALQTDHALALQVRPSSRRLVLLRALVICQTRGDPLEPSTGYCVAHGCTHAHTAARGPLLIGILSEISSKFGIS